MMQKLDAIFRDADEGVPLLQLVGPLSLLFTIALASKIGGSSNLDLAFVGAAGLFLCAKWHVRGSVYSLILVGLSALCKHLFFVDRHALQFGFEASAAFALLISGLAFQESSFALTSLSQKISANEQTIRNLEDELAHQQEERANELTAARDKAGALTQTIEEIQSENSALQVLNEVLRKSTAKALADREEQAEAASFAKGKMELMFQELDALQNELYRLKDESALAQENRALFEEINAVRCKEAQTHQINETLVRLHAKEAGRAKELEGRAAALDLEVEKAREEISFARAEAQMSAAQVEQLAAKIQPFRDVQRSYEESCTERSLLREKIAQAEEELHLRGSKLQSLEAQLAELIAKADEAPQVSKTELAEKEHLLQQLRELRAHLAEQAQFGALYRQLRGQFEERNQVLHETRKQLFQIDTQLQTLRAESEQNELEFDPLPAPLRKEFEELEAESRALSEENRLLQDLVTQLIQPENLFSSLSIPKIEKKK